MYQTYYFSCLTENGQMASGTLDTNGGRQGAISLIRAYCPNAIIIELIFAHNGRMAN